MQVLIVDDDDIALEILANSLEQFGHQVTTASCGSEALELMRSGSFRLVILDWEMPGMTESSCADIFASAMPAATSTSSCFRPPRSPKHRRGSRRRHRRFHQKAV